MKIAEMAVICQTLCRNVLYKVNLWPKTQRRHSQRQKCRICFVHKESHKFDNNRELMIFQGKNKECDNDNFDDTYMVSKFLPSLNVWHSEILHQICTELYYFAQVKRELDGFPVIWKRWTRWRPDGFLCSRSLIALSQTWEILF